MRFTVGSERGREGDDGESGVVVIVVGSCSQSQPQPQPQEERQMEGLRGKEMLNKRVAEFVCRKYWFACALRGKGGRGWLKWSIA